MRTPDLSDDYNRAELLNKAAHAFALLVYRGGGHMIVPKFSDLQLHDLILEGHYSKADDCCTFTVTTTAGAADYEGHDSNGHDSVIPTDKQFDEAADYLADMDGEGEKHDTTP